MVARTKHVVPLSARWFRGKRPFSFGHAVEGQHTRCSISSMLLGHRFPYFSQVVERHTRFFFLPGRWRQNLFHVQPSGWSTTRVLFLSHPFGCEEHIFLYTPRGLETHVFSLSSRLLGVPLWFVSFMWFGEPFFLFPSPVLGCSEHKRLLYFGRVVYNNKTCVFSVMLFIETKNVLFCIRRVVGRKFFTPDQPGGYETRNVCFQTSHVVTRKKRFSPVRQVVTRTNVFFAIQLVKELFPTSRVVERQHNVCFFFRPRGLDTRKRFFCVGRVATRRHVFVVGQVVAGQQTNISSCSAMLFEQQTLLLFQPGDC